MKYLGLWMLRNFTFRILLAKNNREINHFTKELISRYFYSIETRELRVHHSVEKREIHCHAIFSVYEYILKFFNKTLIWRNFCVKIVISIVCAVHCLKSLRKYWIMIFWKISGKTSFLIDWVHGIIRKVIQKLWFSHTCELHRK